MQIKNTGESQTKPSVTLLVYGQGGVGKTTFSATAPKPIIADCENGSKYFGLRGIKVDVAQIESWADIQEFYKVAKDSEYETIVVDPIGELMEKLKVFLVNSKEKKWVQYDGSLTIAGWGEMKERMRLFIKAIRDINKHLIIVAHVEEKEDDNKLVKRPKIMTKMSEELIALVDVVGFMETVRVQDKGGEMIDKRIIRVQPSDKYESKDRTGQLGAIIEPDFQKIINACQGNEVYSWSSTKAKKQSGKEVKEEPKEEVKDEQVAKTKTGAKDKLKEALK
jgi:phage nucleotide-binding protein